MQLAYHCSKDVVQKDRTVAGGFAMLTFVLLKLKDRVSWRKTLSLSVSHLISSHMSEAGNIAYLCIHPAFVTGHPAVKHFF